MGQNSNYYLLRYTRTDIQGKASYSDLIVTKISFINGKEELLRLNEFKPVLIGSNFPQNIEHIAKMAEHSSVTECDSIYTI